MNTNRVNRLSRSSFNMGNQSQNRGSQQGNRGARPRDPSGREFDDVLRDEMKRRDSVDISKEARVRSANAGRSINQGVNRAETYDRHARRVDKDGYVIPPQRSTGEKIKKSAVEFKDNLSGVSRDEHGRKVTKDGYVLPPQNSFSERLKNSVNRLQENVENNLSNRASGSKGMGERLAEAVGTDPMMYRTSMGSDFTVDQEKFDNIKNRNEESVEDTHGRSSSYTDVEGDSISGDMGDTSPLTDEGNVDSQAIRNHPAQRAEQDERHVFDRGLTSEDHERMSTMSEAGQFSYKVNNYYDHHGVNTWIPPNRDNHINSPDLDSLTDEEKEQYKAQRHYDHFGKTLQDMDARREHEYANPRLKHLTEDERELVGKMNDNEISNFYSDRYYNEFGKRHENFPSERLDPSEYGTAQAKALTKDEYYALPENNPSISLTSDDLSGLEETQSAMQI